MSALFWLGQVWRGSSTLRVLREIRSFERASAAQVREVQLGLLRNLLRHAQEKVPYYRELFGALGFDWRDVSRTEDLDQLPVLTKDTVRERVRDLVREDVALSSLLVQHTGGSTGTPMTFYRDRAYIEAADAGTYRNLERSGWRPGEMVAFFWGWNDRLLRMGRWEFELRQRLRGMYQFDPGRSGPGDMERWLSSWRSIRPRAVLGYASTIERFARFVEESGRRLPAVKGVFTTAEKLYPEQREIIGRVMGAKVYDCYGSSEVQNVAAECGAGRMHINADYAIVAVDQPARPGAPTPLLVTSLRNYAMPFIRYRIEDTGGLADEGACPCGCAFPVMELGIARESDNFLLPGGRIAHGVFFRRMMYGIKGVDSFQFRQVDQHRIELLVRPLGPLSDATTAALEQVAEQVRALAPGALDVAVRVVEEIPLSAAGKHRFTRSDITGGHASAGSTHG